jgi:uncharacterized membrane protein
MSKITVSDQFIEIYQNFTKENHDEDQQRRLGKLSNSSTTPLMYLVTLMWASLYLILGWILTKEYVILNAENESEWQEKWSFAADVFVSVRREKKLKEIGI